MRLKCVYKLGPKSKSCPMTQKQKQKQPLSSRYYTKKRKQSFMAKFKPRDQDEGKNTFLFVNQKDVDLKAYRISFLFIMTL